MLQPQNAFNKFMDIYFYILGKLEEIISEYIYTPAKVGPCGLGEAYNQPTAKGHSQKTSSNSNLE